MNGSVPERLRERLAARGCVWTATIEHFERIDSTNDRLKAAARAGAPEWSVVLADEQTAGRGRQGRRWVSPAGNVYVSVLLRPRPDGLEPSLLPLAAGLAVSDALVPFGLRTRLKWPNDVVVEDRKIAGILAEALSTAGGIEAVVLGIGVNVKLEPATLPADLGPTASSIQAETGHAPEPVEVVVEVLCCLTRWYDALGRDSASMLQEWRKRSVRWWGRPVEIVSGDQQVRGIARDVAEDGALVLELPDGTSTVVRAGEARELRLAGGSR